MVVENHKNRMNQLFFNTLLVHWLRARKEIRLEGFLKIEHTKFVPALAFELLFFSKNVILLCVVHRVPQNHFHLFLVVISIMSQMEFDFHR